MFAVVAVAVILAVLLGSVVGIFGGSALIFGIPILLAILVLADYRVGVVFLAVALPFQGSPLLPQTQGFNPITYVILAAFISLIMRRIFRPQDIVLPPRVVVLCLVVPLVMGAILALPHLKQGMYNFAEQTWATNYQAGPYIKIHLIRPLTFIFFAVLVANAVRDSRVPERFLALLALAAILPAIGTVAAVMAGGFSLDEMQSKRDFLGQLGLHSNGAGKLMAFVFAPMLWMTFSVRGARRFFLAIVTVSLLVGVVLTMTRAAYLAVIVVVAIFLWQRKQIRLVILTGSIAALFVMAGPEAFRERMTQGLDPSTIQRASEGSTNDKLTAGRMHGYVVLTPEILNSPLWGKGTGSTAWSTAVTQRQYRSIHPHNMYLAAAMDIGLIGLALTLYFYYRHIKTVNILSASATFSPLMRAFFAGSSAGIIGILIYSLTNGLWFPDVESSYMWFVYGLLYAYWSLAQRSLSESRRHTSDVRDDTALPAVSGRHRVGSKTAPVARSR